MVFVAGVCIAGAFIVGSPMWCFFKNFLILACIPVRSRAMIEVNEGEIIRHRRFSLLYTLDWFTSQNVSKSL
jgi:hypothetical protein